MRGGKRRASAALSLAGGVWIALGVLTAAAPAQTAAQRELLADLEAFEAERAAYRRLLPGDEGLSPVALAAYREALLAASGRWVERWPTREFAWRARLQALLGVERLLPDEARMAVDQALAAGRSPSGIVYAEPLELLAARVLVQHQTRLNEARRLATAGLQARSAFLDRLAARRTAEARAAIDERRLRWRRQAALILVRAAAAEGDLQSWRAALADLTTLAPDKPGLPDRDSAIAYAAAWLEIHLQRARLALAAGQPEQALQSFQRAVSLRPAFPGKVEPPANQAALDEALAAWMAAGRSREDWDSWVSRQKGFSILRRGL